MNKILCISHAFEGNSGWKKAGVDFLLALDKSYDICSRAIRLNEKLAEVPEQIKRLENKSTDGCDTILNLVLPHHIEYDGRFRNIAYFFHETNFIPEIWSSRLQLMDIILVPNESLIETCKRSGITKPIYCVPPPVDTSKFEQTYQPIPILKDKIKDTFSFLIIADFNRRKNLGGILKAFQSEFHPSEPVNLVLKMNKWNTSSETLSQMIRKMSEEIKLGLRLYPNINDYHQEIVITESLSDEDILRLHYTTDCLVSASFGEAFGQPILDSMGLGNMTIVNKVGASKDFAVGLNEYDLEEDYWKYDANSFTITEQEQNLEPCFGMESLPELFTARESWWNPGQSALMNRMRMAFNLNKEQKSIISKNALDAVYEYGYDRFLEKIREIL